MDVKFITGKHSDGTPQRAELQRICKALWLTLWPGLILKSLSWIIISNVFLHLRATQQMTETPRPHPILGYFTLTCQSRLSANIDITRNNPTDVPPFKWVGAEPTTWRSHKHGNMQPKDFQWIGMASCTENSVSWVEHELYTSIWASENCLSPQARPTLPDRRHRGTF